MGLECLIPGGSTPRASAHPKAPFLTIGYNTNLGGGHTHSDLST